MYRQGSCCYCFSLYIIILMSWLRASRGRNILQFLYTVRGSCDYYYCYSRSIVFMHLVARWKKIWERAPFFEYQAESTQSFRLKKLCVVSKVSRRGRLWWCWTSRNARRLRWILYSSSYNIILCTHTYIYIVAEKQYIILQWLHVITGRVIYTCIYIKGLQPTW